MITEWRIVSGSAGSFLEPPGSALHKYEIQEIAPRANPKDRVQSVMALDTTEEWVPEGIRERAAQLIAESPKVMSEAWVRGVYGYFRNCYSPDGVNRKASDCIIPKKGEPVPPAEHHLAFMLIREHFPDATPRLDLIESGGEYGTRECVKCGVRLQYEAKVDRFAEAITCKLECPEGGEHESRERAREEAAR